MSSRLAIVAEAGGSELTLKSARGRIALVATVGASGMAMLDATVVTGAVGPFLGGVLVDGLGWRWAFLINRPLAVAVAD